MYKHTEIFFRVIIKNKDFALLNTKVESYDKNNLKLVQALVYEFATEKNVNYVSKTDISITVQKADTLSALCKKLQLVGIKNHIVALINGTFYNLKEY